MQILFGFIECFTTTTHSWLYWVDEDDWWGWGWLERKARRHFVHQKDCMEIRFELRWVRAKDLMPNFAIIGNYRLGNRQGHHSLEGPGRGWNPYPGTKYLKRTWYESGGPLCKAQRCVCKLHNITSFHENWCKWETVIPFGYHGKFSCRIYGLILYGAYVDLV